MIVFGEEQWLEIRDEVLALWPEHYAEAFGDDDYDPITEEYDMLASVGVLCLVTARRSGELVGYMLWAVRNHPLQRNVLWGILDNYWLKKDARGPRVALRMIRAAEVILRARGVRKAYALERVGGRLFETSGWQAKELAFLRRFEP